MLAPGRPAHGQFITFSLEIEPEMAASEVSGLDFRAGTRRGPYRVVDLGQPGTGVFRISTAADASLLVRVSLPDRLISADGYEMRAILEAAFASRSRNDPREAVGVPVEGLYTHLMPAQQPGGRRTVAAGYRSGFLYIFGGLEIDDIVTNLYLGAIVVAVEYL
jgi:hypothetical protein